MIGSRLGLAAVLQALALAALLWSLTGLRGCDSAGRSGTVLLVDRSASLEVADVDDALTRVQVQLPRQRGASEVVAFAAAPARAGADAADRSQTDIEAAVLDALAGGGHRFAAPARLVVISDGHATRGDTGRALRAARAAGTSVIWQAVAAPERARIRAVLAPQRVAAGAPAPIEVRVHDAGQVTRVRASLRGNDAASYAATTDSSGVAHIGLPEVHGETIVDLQLLAATDGTLLDEWRPAAVIGTQAPARILLASSAPSALATSLAAGGWAVERIAADALDAYTNRLGAYSTVVLEDVPIEAARPAFWAALDAALRRGELGVLASGLEHAFAAGAYRGSMLEAALPLQSHPAALAPAASVVFAIDKSGSMGERSRGVDRFALARRAVLDSVQTLSERDRAAILVFDVEASTIAALDRATQIAGRASAPWPVVPRGGTSLATGIDAALQLFATEPTDARRILLLVTDGFVGDTGYDALRTRLAAAQVELVAFAIGPDADAGALSRLVSPGRGTVLRVEEAARLPALMRSGLQRQRALIERGEIAVRARAALGALRRDLAWPTLQAHAVVTPAPQATVLVESARGDPLIAVGSAGLGPVVAVATALDGSAARWLAWNRWPELAAALLSAARPGTHAAGLALRVRDRDAELEIELDALQGADWSQGRAPELALVDPLGRQLPLTARAAGPGRFVATVAASEAGVYRIAAGLDGARAQWLHLRRDAHENDRSGVNPQLAAWHAEGLLLLPEDLAQAPRAARALGGQDPIRLAWLAALLFVLGVLVDRAADLGRVLGRFQPGGGKRRA